MQSLLTQKPKKEITKEKTQGHGHDMEPATEGFAGEMRGASARLPLFLRPLLESHLSESAHPVQPKLAVNTPGDAFEQEANRVAEHIDSTPLEGGISSLSMPTVQRACACGGADDDCPKCRAHAVTIQRKIASSTSPTSPTKPTESSDAVSRTLQASGQPLDAGIRADMEAHFGYDFSSVRVHTDGEASRSAQEIHAFAYTSGANIAFRAGQYRPASTEGRKLLAHELTHVVQQGQAPFLPQQSVGRMPPVAASSQTASGAIQRQSHDGGADAGAPASASDAGVSAPQRSFRLPVRRRLPSRIGNCPPVSRLSAINWSSILRRTGNRRHRILSLPFVTTWQTSTATTPI